MSTWDLHPIFDSYLIVGVLTGTLLALLFIGPSYRRLSRRQRGALIALRLGVIAMVLFAMLRPTWHSEKRSPQPRTLIILLDRSRSMQVRDDTALGSRWEQLQEAIEAALPELEDLPEELELTVKVYTFDTGPEGVAIDDLQAVLDADPRGPQSDMGTSLDEVVRRELGQQIAAVFLLGDGAQRAYAPRVNVHQATHALVAQKKPLYTITFGQARDASELGDVAIEGLADHYTLFVKNEMRVQGGLLIHGRFTNRDIPLRLLVEDPDGEESVLASERYTAHQSGERISLDFGFTPQKPGQYKLTLLAEEQEGELVTENNQMSAFVTVLDGGIKVLYVDANPTWQEQKFIYRALDAAPDIEIDYFAFNNQDHEGSRRQLEPMIGESLHDVYLLGDVSANALGEAIVQSLAEEVDSGKGLMMHGGFFSFGPGGYGFTPLRDRLPITLGRITQSVDGPILHQLHIEDDVHIVPTPQPDGKPHFVMRLAQVEENEQVWGTLPAMRGANRFDQLKPTAHLLAESSTGDPLLVAGDYGGRVLAFAGDSTWRWWRQGHEVEHKRFWRQAVLWLARKDQAVRDDVWITLPQRRFGPGIRIDFNTGAVGADGDPIEDADFEAVLIHPDGTRSPARLSRDGAEFVGSIDGTNQPGDYEIEVTVRRGGTEIGTARANFLVFDEDLELTDPSANPSLMDSIARTTAPFGGRALPPEDLPALLAQIVSQPPDEEVATEIRWQLADKDFDAWLFFLNLLSLFTGEWYFRKRWGLV